MTKAAKITKAAKVNIRNRKNNKHKYSIAKNLEKKLSKMCLEYSGSDQEKSEILALYNKTVKRYCKLNHIHRNKVARKHSQLYKITRNTIKTI